MTSARLHKALLWLVALWLGSALTPAMAQEKLTIGFLLKTMQEERYEKDRAHFLARAEELGVAVLFASADNDERRQVAQFEEMLAKGARAIVLQPVNTRTAGAMTRMAREKGVPVVGYDALLLNGPLDFMVMQDSWKVGELQGEALVSWLRQKRGKPAGTVALIKGHPGDSNAGAMSSGFLQVIAKYPAIRLILEQSHENWSSDLARQTAERVLGSGGASIDAFVCNNSGMARGVVAALAARGLADGERVFVAGADADLANLRHVAQGRQTVEVWKKIQPLAAAAVDVAARLARGETVKADRAIENGYVAVPTIVTPVVLVTRDNLDQTVVASGFYSREQVYGDS